MPDFLGAAALKRIAGAVVDAVRHDRPVVAAFGAHVIKVGCSPILIDLIRRGVIRAIACNGACAIHDVELATIGETSEEVAETIRDGSFGMVTETMAFFDAVSARAKSDAMGLGKTGGRHLIQKEATLGDRSSCAAAFEASIRVGIHGAIGAVPSAA